MVGSTRVADLLFVIVNIVQSCLSCIKLSINEIAEVTKVLIWDMPMGAHEISNGHRWH